MAYKLPVGDISAEYTSDNNSSYVPFLHHTVYFNASDATSLKVEAKIDEGVYITVAESQTDDYETYNLCGVIGWRLTPTGGTCSPYICGID